MRGHWFEEREKKEKKEEKDGRGLPFIPRASAAKTYQNLESGEN